MGKLYVKFLMFIYIHDGLLFGNEQITTSQLHERDKQADSKS